MEEFTNPKSVKIPAMRIPTNAGSVSYPGRNAARPNESAMMASHIQVRMESTVPAMDFTFSGSSLWSEISRTVMV